MKYSFIILIFTLTYLQVYSNIDSLNYRIDTTSRLTADTTGIIELVYFDDSLKFVSLNKGADHAIPEEVLNDTPSIRMLDSLVNIKFFSDEFFVTDTAQLNVYRYPTDEVPQFNDSVYEARIAYLNRKTPFELTFNTTVKNYINIYAVKKRGLTSRVLGLSEIYFPLFEETLDEYDIPLELKYLAVVESALHPKAGSRAGAKGLWQFMYRTGKVYDLQVTSYVDDRYDPYKSTIAACQHLKDLHDIYHDWSLALAAEHNIYPTHPGILYNGIDTVHVNDVLSFDQISEFLNIPMEDVDFLNPSFKMGIIPANSNDVYVLRLPREYVGEYVSNQEEIHNFVTEKGIDRQKLLAQIEKAKGYSLCTIR